MTHCEITIIQFVVNVIILALAGFFGFFCLIGILCIFGNIRKYIYRKLMVWKAKRNH